MANTPKKVKDPTEVALSAIQEALNISDTTVDTSRNSIGNDMAPPTISSAAPSYSETPYDTRDMRQNADRPVFDPIEEPSDRSCRRSRRAALPAASIRLQPSSAPSGWSAPRFSPSASCPRCRL